MAKNVVATAFNVGDQVAFAFGNRRVRGHIVEQRGPLGVGGEELYQVRLDMDPYEPMFLMLSESDMEFSRETDAPLTKGEIREYLVNGGLLLILGSNRDGRSGRVWLRRDNLGNVTHTFNPDAGLVGGAVPPVFTTQFGRILRAKQLEVERFLGSFGLSSTEAGALVKEVGLQP